MYEDLDINTTDNAMIPFREFVYAYYDCRRTKRRKQSATEFEMDWESNIYKLYDEVNAKTYEIGKSITFVTTRPKKREVFAASFRDRVVHHLVCRKIEPLFENYFIHESYNCRKGKGTSYGVKRLHEKIAEVSQNYTCDCWIAKFDMQGFFMSIHKPTLWSMLEKFLTEHYHASDKEIILWLVKKIVLHSPEKNCIRKMPPSMWHDIPANKSLFTNGDDYGLPIGNLTSQMFANFYLTDFDKWMESQFCYGRYVDDFFVIDTDKRKILKAIPEMRKQLARVQVKLHPNKVYIQHYSKGCSFIGGIVRKERIYTCRRTVDNFMMAVKRLNEVEDKESEAEHAVQQLNSYLGFLKHRRTYKYRRQCINALDPTWYEYFYIVGDCDKLKLKAKYTPKAKLRNILNLLTSNINKYGKNNDSKDRLCAMRQSRREHLQIDVPSGGR